MLPKTHLQHNILINALPANYPLATPVETCIVSLYRNASLESAVLLKIPNKLAIL